MHSQLLLLVATLGLGSVALADADVGTENPMAQACASCHGADGLDLSGTGTDRLVASIKAIQAGDTKHPTPLGGLSDAEVAGIAEILDRGF